MNLPEVFTILYEDSSKCDVQEIVDSPETAKITKVVQKAYNISKENKTLSYLIFFNRSGKLNSLIIEQRLMKCLYRDHNISLDPWIKFKGHVIIQADDFLNKVDPEVIKNLNARDLK